MTSRTAPALVSVVVPVRNGASTIRQTLEGLAAQTYPGDLEVIVVDNGSTDGTREVVLRGSLDGLRVRVVQAPARPGVAYARNAGWRAASGDFIAYCDSDDVPAPDWLSALAKAAGDADVVGGSLDLDSLNAAALRAVYSHEGFPLADLPRPYGFLTYAPSCNIGVWADVLAAVGGWNEAYDSGGEDADFSWRVQLAGFRLQFVPQAVVRFRLRTSLAEIARQAYRDGATMPHLYADFARSGMPRRRLVEAAMSWAWVILASPLAFFPGPRRVAWVRRAAQHAGRLVASIRYHVLFL